MVVCFFFSLSGSVIIIGYFMKFTVAAPRPNIFSVYFDSGISSRQFQILVSISLKVFEKLNDIGNNGARLKKKIKQKNTFIFQVLCVASCIRIHRKIAAQKQYPPKKFCFTVCPTELFFYLIFLL